MRKFKLGALAGLLAMGFAAQAAALTVPFTEEFVTDVAGWEDSINNPLTYVAGGGPDGSSYASTTFNYFGFVSPFGGGPVTFRGSDSDDASGDAFVGDWVAGNVLKVSAWVRQDTGVDLGFFLRVASAFNFPGAVISNTASVASGVWTEVSWDIDPLSANCTPEGTTCLGALQGVGNIQFGTDAPAALTGGLDQAFTLDLDKVTISAVPEPVAALLLNMGMLGLALFSNSRAVRG